jgi:hypothetical protein
VHRSFLFFTCGWVKNPSLSSIINWQNLSAHFFKRLQCGRQVMNDSKITIKRFDVAWNFIVTVPVINFRKGSFKHLSSFVNVEIEL